MNLKKGEIATAITLAAFVFVTASAIVSNVFLGKNKQTTSSLALSTPACASFFKQGLDNQGYLPVANVGEYCILCTGNQGPCEQNAGVGVPYQYEAGGGGSSWVIRNKAGECNETCRVGTVNPTTPQSYPTIPAGGPTSPPPVGTGCGYSTSGKFLPNGYCSPLTSTDTRYCLNGSWPKNDSICKLGNKFCVGNGYKPTGDFGCCSGTTDSSGSCSLSGGGSAPTVPPVATATKPPVPTPTTEYYSHCCNGANRIGCQRGNYTGGCSGIVVTSSSSCGTNVCSQTPSNVPIPTSVPAVCIMSGAKGFGCASRLGGNTYCSSSFGSNYYCDTVADCCVGTATVNTPTLTPVPPTDVPPTDVPPTDVPPTDVPPTPVPDLIVEIPSDIVTWGATVLMDPSTNVLINNILGMMGAGSLNLNDPSTINPFIDFILTNYIKPAISNYNAQHVDDGLAIDVINEDLLKREVKNVIEVMNHQYKAYMADPAKDTFNMTITVRESPSVVQLNVVVKFVGAIQAGEYTHDISLDRAKFKTIAPQLSKALSSNNSGFIVLTLNAMLTANNSKYTIDEEMLKYNIEGVHFFLKTFQENPDRLNQFDLLITYLTYTNQDGSPKDSVRVNYKIRFEPQVQNGMIMSYPQ